MDDPRHGNQPWQQQYAPPAPKARPNHVLHLILTIVTCLAWSPVWITLTARYWNVVDWRNPAERPGMDRRTWITIGVIAVLSIGGGVIGSMAPTSSTTATTVAEESTTAAPAATTAAKDTKTTKAAAPAEPAAEAEPKIKAPKGVTVSGDYAETLQVRSLKATRSAIDLMDADLRVKNISDDDVSFVSIKLTALRGEEVIATADGIIESIDAGQTITTSLLSGDDFPSNRKGITYELEME